MNTLSTRFHFEGDDSVYFSVQIVQLFSKYSFKNEFYIMHFFNKNYVLLEFKNKIICHLKKKIYELE